MRILFLCGSLEPGRDGVGDYTRRLVSELSLQNHHVSILALNDGFVSNVVEGTEKEKKLSFLRIPCCYSYDQKLSIANSWVHEFKPDWISLQFVPFSFHAKGLPINLSKFLKSIDGRHKWHIMFHELWTITKSSLPSKIKLTGYAQRLLIKQIVNQLKPDLIHTQAEFSKFRLKKNKIAAEVLPLFSNIPSRSKGKYYGLRNKINPIKIVSFGSIYPNALIKQFAEDAACYVNKHNIQIELTLVGNSGPQQNYWITEWRKAGLTINVLGELPPEQVSETLSSSTIGISSTPFVMMEKSGSVAAMREHGLTVICIADPYSPKKFTFRPPVGIIDYSSNGFEKCINYCPENDTYHTVADIAQKLSVSLTT